MPRPGYAANLLKGAVIAGGLTVATISGAVAGPLTITFDPAAVGLATEGAFKADRYTLADYATAVINNATGQFTETGTLKIVLFGLGADAVLPPTSGLLDGKGTGAYGLYKTFVATGVLPGFVAPKPGHQPPPVNGYFTSVSYNFLGDPGNKDTVSAGGVLHDVGGNDILLGSGVLGGASSVAIGGAGVPTADALLTLARTMAGEEFMQAPVVKFQEDAFTNTPGVFRYVLTPKFTDLIITNGGGNGDFAAPEPASLLLVGTGLLGLGVVRKLRKRS